MTTTLRIISINFAWVIGLGYWIDVYESPKGYDVNIIVPLVRIRISYIEIKEK